LQSLVLPICENGQVQKNPLRNFTTTHVLKRAGLKKPIAKFELGASMVFWFGAGYLGWVGLGEPLFQKASKN
jgi:hypothetical protein